MQFFDEFRAIDGQFVQARAALEVGAEVEVGHECGVLGAKYVALSLWDALAIGRAEPRTKH